MSDKARRPRWIPVDSRIGERWSGLTAIAWGVWLLLPWQSFTVPTFRWLGQLLPENVAGGLMVALGLATLLVASNGARSRVAFNAALTFAWSFLAVTSLLSLPPSTAFVLQGMMALKQMTFVVNAYLDVKAEQWQTGRENSSP